jgi:hypothetical protein
MVFASLHQKSDKQGMNSLFVGSPSSTTISYPFVMDYKDQSFLADTQHNNKVIRSGPVNVRKRRAFSGTTWKPRRLELHFQTLTIVNVSRLS